jgi:hypothetical protein
MLNIIVDKNNDSVMITNRERVDNTTPMIAIFRRVHDTTQVLEILDEIFNRLDPSRLASATPSFDVRLSYYDEDQHRTKGEW